MAYKAYKLGIQLHTYPKGSIAIKDEWEWHIGPDSYDTRGSIMGGEFALLLDYLAAKEFTTILSPLDEEAEQ